jgi:hypothetical protein
MTQKQIAPTTTIINTPIRTEIAPIFSSSRRILTIRNYFIERKQPVLRQSSFSATAQCRLRPAPRMMNYASQFRVVKSRGSRTRDGVRFVSQAVRFRRALGVAAH